MSYDSLTFNSSSLELLLSAKMECFSTDIHFAQAMFPEFFAKKTMEVLRTNVSKTPRSLAGPSRPENRQKNYKSNEAIEIWYINEYGLEAT